MTIRSRARRALLVLGSALALGWHPLVAQVSRDTVQLPDLVTTETRLPTRRDAVAAALTVLDGDELRLRGVRFVHDALRDVPGFQVVQPGSFGAVTSVFARGGESDYVKVLIDGVPANQPGGAFDFASLTLDNVDRIEVVRGPASVAYGSDAVAGVVQIFTRTGRDGAVHGSIAAQGGTFDSRALDAALSGGSERLGWSAGAARFQTDGIYDFNNRYGNTSLSGRVRGAPDRLTEASLTARYRRDTYHFPTDGSGVPSDSNQFTSSSLLTIGAEVGRRVARGVEARLTLASADSDAEAEDDPDAAADSIGFAFASRRRADVSRRSADLRADLRPVRHAVVSVGGQLEREHERQTGSVSSNFGAGPFTEDAPPFDERRTNRAGYVQALVDLPNGLAVNAGGRLDDNGRFGTFGTYRIGAAWRLRSGTRLRMAAGSAFKAPTFSENFASSPFEVGNPSLQPERVRSWEIGVEQPLLAGRVSLSAAWFDQRFRDLIQYVTAAPGEPTYTNLGAARARGIEAGLLLRPAAGLTLSGDYTWLDTEATDAGASLSPGFAAGERLIRRPTHAGRAALRYVAGEQVTLAAGISFVGGRDDVDFRTFPSVRVTLPAYQLVDLAADIVIVRGSARAPSMALTGRLENALDAGYQPIVGFEGRGRTVFAGLRVAR